MKVTLNGVEQAITNQQLYELAAKGLIGPNTIIHVNGKPFPAGQAKGIVFGPPTGAASTSVPSASPSDGQDFELPKRSEVQKQHDLIVKERNIREQQAALERQKQEMQDRALDYRLVAERQRFFISCFGFSICFYFMAVLLPPAIAIAFLFRIGAIIPLVLLLESLKYGTFTRPFLIVGHFIPLVGLVIDLVIISQTTNALKTAGYHVGLFGPDMKQFGQSNEKGRNTFRNFAIVAASVFVICILFAGFNIVRENSRRTHVGRGSVTAPAPRLESSIPMDEIALIRKEAVEGDATAQNNLGVRYFEGDGVPQDYQEAVKWFQKAAEKEYPMGQFHLAICYENGHGVEKDLKEAANWFRKAAEQDNEYAQYRLASCYEEGNGVEEDFVEAMKWYRKVAERDSSEPIVVQAQYVLGVGYYEGIGVMEDEVEAKKWLEKAAKGGNQDAVELLKEGFDDEEPK